MKLFKRLSILAAITGLAALSDRAAAQSDFSCAPTPLEAIDRTYDPGGWNYDRERVANTYAIYAAASYDAYEPTEPGKEKRPFAIADNDPNLSRLSGDPGVTGWRLVRKGVGGVPGLSYDVYHRNEAARLVVLVAYRGTDGWLNADGIANASWFTQWFNPYDQYRAARNEFPEVVAEGIRAARGKPIAFITTGHSLGGGLAQHVAAVFRCVSTIVFNSSFVTNTLFYGNYTPEVRIRLYEDNDAFSRFASRMTNTKNDALYRMNGTLGRAIVAQHSMERLAATMMRTALACLDRPDCDIRRDGVGLSRTLLCARYRSLRPRNWQDDICRRNAPSAPAFSTRTMVELHD
ncbi:hypothetical protein E8L99_07220 [Phreatobacter aquaticus]|uniref:DUF2974 domain-containing protein n=1 Tax=Phreatobacter aquaticus TaxID=2570229 RepID=A0A4D7QN32_9HYPH|nr:hypothetical protein [Phreatobacter aquaticus]QCK85572.1 hypothetical protein E8L99_07220 [Phreatobacter aquaticus]